MIKTSVKHCGYGFIEETANDLLDHMKENERYVDLKIKRYYGGCGADLRKRGISNG